MKRIYPFLLIICLGLSAQASPFPIETSPKYRWEIGLPHGSINYNHYWNKGFASRFTLSAGLYTGTLSTGTFFPRICVDTRYFALNPEAHKGFFAFHQFGLMYKYKTSESDFAPASYNLSSIGIGYRHHIMKRLYAEAQVGVGAFVSKKGSTAFGRDFQLNFGYRF